MAANLLRAHWRRERGDSAGQPDHLAAPADRAADLAARTRAALLRLPERYRDVLRAKYLDQQPVADIAAAQGISCKAVESLLTRARHAFRGLFDQQEDGT